MPLQHHMVAYIYFNKLFKCFYHFTFKVLNAADFCSFVTLEYVSLWIEFMNLNHQSVGSKKWCPVVLISFFFKVEVLYFIFIAFLLSTVISSYYIFFNCKKKNTLYFVYLFFLYFLDYSNTCMYTYIIHSCISFVLYCVYSTNSLSICVILAGCV